MRVALTKNGVVIHTGLVMHYWPNGVRFTDGAEFVAPNMFGTGTWKLAPAPQL
jgi:hypothetical protein